ncbi:MAG: type II secretion system F family protein [Treponema sp.]|uniref:type II secretion system F family protein n=1 Tax=Treponema sp. TaxID=166 RepID=UPI0025FACA5B|nr:type II secretion system F family protein [Treponema sp.]MBR0100650.1 type II secretion system F family protein [Treponema sp.]MBR0496045.1 type II secretion system F family protein [Treponema sp.]
MRIKSISRKNLLSFTVSMSALLNSSLQVQDAVSLCKETSRTKEVRILCMELISVLNKGEKLNTALQSIRKGIPPIYTAIVKIGEESARLPLVFEKLASYLFKLNERQSKLRVSLIYPLTVLSAALILCSVILFYVFPRMSDIFSIMNFDEKIRLPDLNMLTFRFIRGIILMLALIFIPIVLHKKNSASKSFIDAVILKIPFLNESIKNRECENYSFAMELLTESGVPLYKSMQLANKVIINSHFRKSAETAARLVCEGTPVSESFETAGNFPSYMIQWLNIGEKTGRVTEVFNSIHSFYEKKSETERNTGMTLIEPVCILLTGGIVAILICNFVLPIFNIMGDL